ncbi:MAG: hypothetical protein N4A57_00150 [Anaeromicrobium sp.]|jgi:hypothetical protein|uniref:hypothetical protein n=1 Tax=Anaeromicrobium sp. TaxID=1929132 RepID=UPI0025EB55A0|nr:hypothetical protein [Anaeromicrobium sp.]MCT4592674.1 hypothetical protein [Anaeromicrobium sp.]
MNKVTLHLAGEIRFGPRFFEITINEIKLEDRSFGELYIESSDMRYVALQEWGETQYSKGPMTRVLIVEASTGKLCETTDFKRGFVEEFKFSNGKFEYMRHDYGLKKKKKEVLIVNNLKFC